MKTLNTIQTLSKLGKIFSRIVYICSIVGLCVGAVGILAVSIGAETIKFGGVTLHGILETKAEISLGTAWAALASEMILCVGELFVSRMAYRYFENELRAGTPFTSEGARELMHLGISVVWIPILTAILAQVAHGVIAQLAENVESLSLDGFGSVGLGIAIIIVSLVCRCGAESGEKKE